MEVRSRRERGQEQNFISPSLESGEQDKEESPKDMMVEQGKGKGRIEF